MSPCSFPSFVAVPQFLSPLLHCFLSRHTEGDDGLRTVGVSGHLVSDKPGRLLPRRQLRAAVSHGVSPLSVKCLTSFAIWKVINTETSASRSSWTTGRDS